MERIIVPRKATWTREEDDILKAYIEKHGEVKWNLVPQRTGLDKCRRSCRQRWLNHLKRGEFMDDEVDLILRMHRLLGNIWTLIAGRIPVRTANDIKNYWNTHYKLHNAVKNGENNSSERINGQREIFRPMPLTFKEAIKLKTFEGNHPKEQTKEDVKIINSETVGNSEPFEYLGERFQDKSVLWGHAFDDEEFDIVWMVALQQYGTFIDVGEYNAQINNEILETQNILDYMIN